MVDILHDETWKRDVTPVTLVYNSLLGKFKTCSIEGAMSEMQDVRYPMGKPVIPDVIAPEDRADAITALAEMPELLREALRGLSEEQLDTPYREGGWTVRQLVHHIADSHMVAFFRMRSALTAEMPSMPDYDENAFAALPDAAAPAEWSVDLLEGLHARWVFLLQRLTEEQWQRGYRHSVRGPQVLDRTALLYAWHSRHHVAHITHLRVREGW